MGSCVSTEQNSLECFEPNFEGLIINGGWHKITLPQISLASRELYTFLLLCHL